MVTLPENLTAIKYPGYFWNTKTHELYSIKVAGELRKVTKRDFGYIKQFAKHAWRLDAHKYVWQISVKGKRKLITDKYLYGLKGRDSVIPYANINV